MIRIRDNKILQALIVVAAVWLLLKLSSILVVVFIAFIFTVVLYPLVAWLQRRHLPVWLSVALTAFAVLFLLALISYFIVPTIYTQLRHFIDALPGYLSKLPANQQLHFDFSSIRSFVQKHFGTIGNALVVLTGAAIRLVVGVVTVIVTTIYWLGTYDRTRRTLLTYVPIAHRDRAADIWDRVEIKIGHWFRAQVLLSLVVGVLIGIGSWAIGLPFPLVLGLIGAVLELVPTLGPIAATVPGAAIGFAISVKVGVLAIVLHIIIQQIESHILAPWLMGRTVNLHPIIIIVSLLSGTALYGILGALLAVPTALVISAFVDNARGDPLRKPKKLPDAAT